MRQSTHGPRRTALPRRASPFLVAVLIVLPLVLAAGLAGAGRWVAIGSGTTERVAADNDPLTWEELPPFAFGPYENTDLNTMWLEMIVLPCHVLPQQSLCEDGSFVAAVQGDLDAGTCPCTGVLVKQIQVQIHYDAERVRALGARESDLRMVTYRASTGDWAEISGGFEVRPAEDVIRGWQGSHIAQIYAVVTGPPGESATWGEIKAQWR